MQFTSGLTHIVWIFLQRVEDTYLNPKIKWSKTYISNHSIHTMFILINANLLSYFISLVYFSTGAYISVVVGKFSYITAASGAFCRFLSTITFRYITWQASSTCCRLQTLSDMHSFTWIRRHLNMLTSLSSLLNFLLKSRRWSYQVGLINVYESFSTEHQSKLHVAALTEGHANSTRSWRNKKSFPIFIVALLQPLM